MKAALTTTTFGARGVKDVQQYLPMVLTERESSHFRHSGETFSWLIMGLLATNTCAFSIDITAPDDKAPWYDLWQAAVALDGICARAGRTGKARLIGEGRRI